MTHKILVVDDDETLLRFVSEYLKREGFQVLTADRGALALRQLYEERPDLIVLDVMMPGMDGWEVCARVRELTDIPVVMLTAKTSEADKLRGFRLGVDDYVTKPFSLAELAARIRAVLSRSSAQHDGEPAVYHVGPLVIDLRRREVLRGEEPVSMTPTEFRLLSALARRASEAVSQEDLVTEVWGSLRQESCREPSLLSSLGPRMPTCGSWQQ